MKSKDEQSLDMARVICRAVSTEKCVNGTCSKLWDCPVKISIFEKLVDNGYGNVVEYSQEVERLQMENQHLKAIIKELEEAKESKGDKKTNEAV